MNNQQSLIAKLLKDHQVKKYREGGPAGMRRRNDQVALPEPKQKNRFWKGVGDVGKYLLNTVTTPVESVMGWEFYDPTFSDTGFGQTVGKASKVTSGLTSAATDIAGSMFLGPGYGAVKSTATQLGDTLGLEDQVSGQVLKQGGNVRRYANGGPPSFLEIEDFQEGWAKAPYDPVNPPWGFLAHIGAGVRPTGGIQNTFPSGPSSSASDAPKPMSPNISSGMGGIHMQDLASGFDQGFKQDFEDTQAEMAAISNNPVSLQPLQAMQMDEEFPELTIPKEKRERPELKSNWAAALAGTDRDASALGNKNQAAGIVDAITKLQGDTANITKQKEDYAREKGHLERPMTVYGQDGVEAGVVGREDPQKQMKLNALKRPNKRDPWTKIGQAIAMSGDLISKGMSGFSGGEGPDWAKFLGQGTLPTADMGGSIGQFYGGVNAGFLDVRDKRHKSGGHSYKHGADVEREGETTLPITPQGVLDVPQNFQGYFTIPGALHNQRNKYPISPANPSGKGQPVNTAAQGEGKQLIEAEGGEGADVAQGETFIVPRKYKAKYDAAKKKQDRYAKLLADNEKQRDNKQKKFDDIRLQSIEKELNNAKIEENALRETIIKEKQAKEGIPHEGMMASLMQDQGVLPQAREGAEVDKLQNLGFMPTSMYLNAYSQGRKNTKDWYDRVNTGDLQPTNYYEGIMDESITHLQDAISKKLPASQRRVEENLNKQINAMNQRTQETVSGSNIADARMRQTFATGAGKLADIDKMYGDLGLQYDTRLAGMLAENAKLDAAGKEKVDETKRILWGDYATATSEDIDELPGILAHVKKNKGQEILNQMLANQLTSNQEGIGEEAKISMEEEVPVVTNQVGNVQKEDEQVNVTETMFNQEAGGGNQFQDQYESAVSESAAPAFLPIDEVDDSLTEEEQITEDTLPGGITTQTLAEDDIDYALNPLQQAEPTRTDEQNEILAERETAFAAGMTEDQLADNLKLINNPWIVEATETEEEVETPGPATNIADPSVREYLSEDVESVLYDNVDAEDTYDAFDAMEYTIGRIDTRKTINGKRNPNYGKATATPVTRESMEKHDSDSENIGGKPYASDKPKAGIKHLFPELIDNEELMNSPQGEIVRMMNLNTGWDPRVAIAIEQGLIDEKDRGAYHSGAKDIEDIEGIDLSAVDPQSLLDIVTDIYKGTYATDADVDAKRKAKELPTQYPVYKERIKFMAKRHGLEIPEGLSDF